MQSTAWVGTMLIVLAVVVGTSPAVAADAGEFLCLKDLDAPLEGLSIACYTPAGCAFVETRKAEPLPDYDRESVPYALGREKIEGIVTSSSAIMKKIGEFGYACRKLD
jgi:hypothetical protein